MLYNRLTRSCLMKEFEMKNLGQTKYYLGLQIEYLLKGIFLHQSNYVKKVLKKFYMDESFPLSTPIVVRSLEASQDPFRPKEVHEEALGSKVSYLNAIRALLYLANCTRPNIAFAVNLLVRHSVTPIRRHWTSISTCSSLSSRNCRSWFILPMRPR